MFGSNLGVIAPNRLRQTPALTGAAIFRVDLNSVLRLGAFVANATPYEVYGSQPLPDHQISIVRHSLVPLNCFRDQDDPYSKIGQ